MDLRGDQVRTGRGRAGLPGIGTARPAAGRRCPAARSVATPAGAPTVWNSEFACGRSTTPATVTANGGSPCRWMVTREPWTACRFDAVCCASSTPLPLPVSVRISPGNVVRYPAGMPRTTPAPGCLRRPRGGRGHSVDLGEADGCARAHARACAATSAAILAAVAPLPTCTCQSTGTERHGSTGHGCFGVGEEGAQAGEQRDRDRHAERGSEHAKRLPLRKARQPDSNHSFAPAAIKDQSAVVHRPVLPHARPRWRRSCVAMTSAAPVSSATWTRTSATWSAVARSSWLVGSSARITCGPRREHAGDHDALRLAAGQLLRQIVAQARRCRAGPARRVPARRRPAGRRSPSSSGNSHVLGDGQARDQCRRLEHEADRAGRAGSAGRRRPG